MPKRPVGVMIVAVFLGLISLLLLLLAGSTMLLGFFMPQLPQAAPAQPVAPQFLKIMMLAVGLFYLAVAGWAIATLVGLVRLRNWARLSALVMGGLLAFFGLVSLPVLAVMPRLMAATPSGATLPPGAITGMLVGIGLVYAGMLALGVWWLVYFNLRSVKAYFLPNYSQNPALSGGFQAAAQNPYLPSRASQAESLATPGGLAGHEFHQNDLPAPVAMPVALTGRPHAPTAVSVIGCIFLLGCLSCGAMAFIPLPAFVLGALITGVGVPILYGCLSVLSGYIGLGLLKLWNGARLATYAFLGFGAVNLVVMLMPGYQSKFMAYQGLVNARMGLPVTSTAMQAELFRGAFFPVIVVISLVLYGAVFWILQKYRGAFEKTAASR